MSGIAAILLVGFLLQPDTIFGFLETITTLAAIVLYGMANLALTRYMRREQRAAFTVWQHVVAPWIATLALVPVLFVTVYPVPTWPYDLTPYLFLVALVGGFAYMQWRESRNPGALRRGAMLLIRADGALEDEVEPNEPVPPLLVFWCRTSRLGDSVKAGIGSQWWLPAPPGLSRPPAQTPCRWLPSRPSPLIRSIRLPQRAFPWRSRRGLPRCWSRARSK